MMASMVARGNPRKPLTLRGVDPATCMIVFKNHWAQVLKILEKHEPGRTSVGALSFRAGHAKGSRPIPADEASAVQNYVEHMLFLLMEEEAGQGGAMGPILELVVADGVMERLFLWSLRRQFTDDMKLEQLRMYQRLLGHAHQPLLHHKPVLRPLMMLLASCAGAATDSGGVVEAELVLLLNQLCEALVKDPSVLELFFHTSEDQGAANFLLFSLLIPYTHRQGSVGQQARDALLLIMTLTASEPRVAQHIADNTYFCPVLATGLSGLYSSLPTRLQVYSEDWHCLDLSDWQQVPALVHFLHSLDFCSAVTKVAHPSIRSQLLGYIYNGFLVPVLAPALHKLTVEEVMTTTAYLDLFLRSVSDPALLQTFLSFVLLHTHDGVLILDTLVSRVNTPFQLGTVSLALFRTLIGLFCEDVMLQLVFRYLIPCSHLSRRQYRSLSQKDYYSSSASSFLVLMPSWCPGNLGIINPEHIHWPKGAELWDSVGYCRGSDFLMDVNYLHYLWDASMAISTSQRACQFWSAPYDGVNPSPKGYRSNTPGHNLEDEEELVPQSKRESMCSLLVAPSSVALSPDLSSSDTVTMGNQTGRASSALELEWDDFFADDDPSLSGMIDKALANVSMGTELDRRTSTPAPPWHIQEMRRTATRMVHGSYIEEAEFQDDVMVYNLVAQEDTKAAMLERVTAANRQRGFDMSSGQLVKTGRTVMEAINDIIFTSRRTQDGGKEERGWSEDEEMWGKEEDEDEKKMTDECEDTVVDVKMFKQKSTMRDRPPETQLPNGLSDAVSHDPLQSPNNIVTINDDFLSRYSELMLSLGVEPDCDDIIDDISTFRKRVRVLRKKMEQEEGLGEETFFSCSSNDRDEEEEEEEEEVEVMEEEEKVQRKRGGVPFTGPFISVLLSRLENLLENPIAVNLLVTGILAQLTSYPQPLLRSFLLSPDSDHPPNIRTLHQVLSAVGAQIEDYMAARPDYPALVIQAWKFLLAKDQERKFREFLQPQDGDIILDLSLPNGSLRKTLAPPPPGILPPCPPIPSQDKSRVFAIILYAEFLKELAAVAQEHSITA
ncbi:FHF complex subunit HOOK-interacting protein 1A-like [Antennarius striatus]|uniref:FHF complex subunit HOOK-interacting protein 1A-like n=1 Tax=Antennarius striatus TaxID=241820 RepID=UPI0035B2FA09